MDCCDAIRWCSDLSLDQHPGNTPVRLTYVIRICLHLELADSDFLTPLHHQSKVHQNRTSIDTGHSRVPYAVMALGNPLLEDKAQTGTKTDYQASDITLQKQPTKKTAGSDFQLFLGA